jgi:hypothetical protein
MTVSLFGEAGGGDAQRAGAVFAAFGHLLVVDGRELGVLLADEPVRRRG